MFGIDDILLGAGAVSTGAGLLGSLFGGDDPSYSSIDLARDNPELYRLLQKNAELIKQGQAAYDMRNRGMTDLEKRGIDSTKSDLGAQQASLGLLGTSQGNAQMADAESRLREQIAARAFQESQALFGNVTNLQNNQFANTRAALNDVYGQQVGDATSRNQFYSGLFGGGMNMLGQGANMAYMDDQRKTYGAYPLNTAPLGTQIAAPAQLSYGNPYSYGLPAGNAIDASFRRLP